MAERGALSLLTLLCLTFFFTEHTAAKHVDKGKGFFFHFQCITLAKRLGFVLTPSLAAGCLHFCTPLLGRIFSLPPEKQTDRRGARGAAVDSEKTVPGGATRPCAPPYLNLLI